MERKIGEIFEFGGEWYQCIGNPYNECTDCDFCFEIGRACVRQIVGRCSMSNRSDGLSVVFKKLEKVGESYMNNEKIVQKYKIYHDPLIAKDGVVERYVPGLIDIVIKQNKEDMEEKKQCGDNRFRAIARAKEHLFQATNIAEDKKELKVLDSFLLRCWQMGWLKQYEDAEEKKLNLKPFDIQKAREGKPVCTRDGHKARIICFDYNGETGDYPIVALVHYNKGNKCYERVLKYTSDGLFNKYGDYQHDDDLMMLPEKKEGWVNVYNSLGVVTFSHNPYDTKEEALADAKPKDYVDTVKINWGE